MMKQFSNYCIASLLTLYCTSVMAQEDCKDDINYSISNITINGAGQGFFANEEQQIQVTLGQTIIAPSGGYTQGITSRNGFWGHYLLEPQAPRAMASQGEHLDRIEVEWEVVDDRLGPPVTLELTKIYRNGKLLTTVPLSQTSFVDYNVFPGEFYTYEIVTTNKLGDAWPIKTVGFLQPNGRITGKVETRTGSPVVDVKVTLTPNLGRSLELDGADDYAYFTDQDYELGDYYTVEGWWRNVELRDQTLIVAVDSGTSTPVMKISLDVDGKLHYYHDGNADGTALELVSKDAYNTDQSNRKWHHFAAVYDTTRVYLYVDGNRVAEATTADPMTGKVELEFGKDGPKLYTGYYGGFLDDVRIWSVGRERAEVRKFMDITLTGEEKYLRSYWKFDEQFSDKVFDFADNPVEDREHGFICGVTRSDFISPAQLGAYTDAGGDYLIRGVFYGSGTTFSVEAEKETPIGYSMEFDGADDFISYQLDRITYNSAFTLEGWVKTPASGKDMVFFETTNAAADQTFIQLGIQSTGELFASVGFGGTLNTITSTDPVNDEFWYHYALVHEGSTVRLYIDGTEVGTTTDAQISQVETRMVIGRSGTIESGAGTDYFEGKLDEIRLWNYARTSTQVNSTLNQVIPGDEQGIVDTDGDLGLMAYWMLGEGQGSIISDATPNGHTGELLNYQETQIDTDEFLVANWDGDDIPLNTEFFVHDFDPNARNSSLDPSNTAVDRVDFTDISQIAISGFVKFADANCFASNVEMKINGESLVPPVFTDEGGKFILELEPGTSGAFLTAESEDFDMNPGFIELPRLVRPIAGLKFEVTTKRKLKGIVVGGECLYATGTANVRLQANDGCFETTVAVDATTGEFLAENLPPLLYQVSVTGHENTVIQSAFDTQGAISADLRTENDSVAFVFTSATNVKVTFETPESNDCNFQLDSETATILNQNGDYSLQAQLYQVYGADTCFLKSGTVYIEDEISDFSPKDTLQLIDGLAEYEFKAGVPNLAAPHEKTITIVGEDQNGDQATAFENVVVLGYKTLTSTFETTTPKLPMFILRDPPGDASYAYMIEDEEVCNTISFDYLQGSTSTVTGAIHMGPDVTLSTGLFISKETEIDVTMDMNFESSATNGFGTQVEYETCLTSSEVFKTSSNDLLSDGEGDVYVGGAFNVLVGTNRVVSINPDNCQIELNDEVMILPTSFATTYIYTEQYIKTGVIPGLQEINDTESVQQWESILAYNNSLKSNAQFDDNISFSAGIEFDRSVTSTQSSAQTMRLSSSFASEVGLNTGLTVDGIGFSLGVSAASTTENGYERSSEKNTSKTVGYSLSDDDIGDNFTVDIKKDSQGMPVFDLVAGESMCPWEPGTQSRAAVSITPISATSLVEVPEDDPAVFRLSVANIGETAEDQFFELRVLQESNPNGAIVSLNGDGSSIGLFIEANKSKEIVVTVEKGPDAYVFNDLELELNVPCEFERAEALGLNIADMIANNDTRSTFFDRQKISVEFVKTCQDATIFSPGENWLISSGSNNVLPVTISEIDLDQVEFEQFKFQYRKQVEGEPYVNGQTILRSSISGDSYSFNWDVTNVGDAVYELRVVSECNSGFLPGNSGVITGRIDRVAPGVLGTPGPVDAVLGPNDEIFIEFEEDINCDAIISLGVAVSLEAGNVNNVALTNTETGLAIEKTVNCIDNRLVIIPDIQNKFIEGQVLRVDLLGLEDLYGNVQTTQTTWEFLVDRDPLEWQGGDIQSVSYEGESPQFIRQVKNNGAFAVNVNLSGALDVQTLKETSLPNWISASPRSFTLQPGGTQDVTFTVSNQIGGGSYEDVVTAATSFGAPELRFDTRVLCLDPQWVIDASRFENSINFIGQLNIKGEMSVDEYDIVAAFVGDQLRGVGKVEYVPELASIPGEHPYLVFMTLYTNSSATETLTFQVWDASRCQLYGQVSEIYEISLQTVSLGSPTNPRSITVTNDLIQDIPLRKGWNWLSFNLSTGSLDTDTRLSTLENSQRGDLIKSQTGYAQFVNGLGWVGPLSSLDSTQAFRIKLQEADTLRIVGEPIDFETTTIPLDSGWNWISYLPPVAMDINEALSSISATADFVIKSQTTFAQYVDFQGWIGSLDFMAPNRGYLIFVNEPATLSYPVNSTNARAIAQMSEAPVVLPEGWQLNPQEYEFNSNVIAIMEPGVVSEGDLIGIFDGDQLVGYGEARFLEFQDQFYFFITYYGNNPGKDLSIRYYSNATEYSASTVLTSAADRILGSIKEPFVVRVPNAVLGTDVLTRSVEVYPNPFTQETTLRLILPESDEVEVTLHNVLGQSIRTIYDGRLAPGNHKFLIQKTGLDYELASGIYLIHIVTDQGQVTKRVILK